MAEFTPALHQILETYTLPTETGLYFERVFKGEPNALMPTTRPVARWKVARTEAAPEGIRTLRGQRQLALVFDVMAYWPLSASEERQQSIEDDIATVVVDLPNRFISSTLTASDYTIGGKAVSVLTVERDQIVDRVVPFPDSPAEMRMFSFELHARLLEAS